MSTHELTKKKAISRAVALATVLSVALGAGCTKKDDDGNLAVFHGALPDNVKTLDPANAYDEVSLSIVPLVYEALYQYHYLNETFKVVPALAADMPKFSADRLTVTIPIQRGIKFHDDPCFKETGGKGRELKAQDFVYGIKRLAAPSVQSQGWWTIDGKIAGINAFHDKLAAAPSGDRKKLFEEPVEGLKALDDYTLQIKLVKPYPQLPYILAMNFTSPVPREAIEAYGDEKWNLDEHPVGTGPFIVKKFDRAHKVILERNPTYHPDFYPTDGSEEYRKKGLLADAGKPLPFLDRISFEIMKESQPQWLSFMKGKLDIMPIPKDNFASAITNQVNLTPELASKGIRLNISTGTRFYFIAFNMKDKVVGGKNKVLRQAISSAIDRDKWIEIFTNGRGQKMVNTLPPGTPDRAKTKKIKYDFDPALARKLLEKAGYPGGKGLPAITFDMRGSDSLNRQMGEFFTQQLAAVGVNLNVVYNTFPAYLEKMKTGNLQVSYGGWALDYPDAENVYQLLYGPNKAPGPNDTNFDDASFNKMYEEMAAMESGKKRAAIVQKMDDMIQEELPWAMGYYHTNYQLSQPWLMNVKLDGIIPNKAKYYRVNREVKARYLGGGGDTH